MPTLSAPTSSPLSNSMVRWDSNLEPTGIPWKGREADSAIISGTTVPGMIWSTAVDPYSDGPTCKHGLRGCDPPAIRAKVMLSISSKGTSPRDLQNSMMSCAAASQNWRVYSAAAEVLKLQEF